MAHELTAKERVDVFVLAFNDFMAPYLASRQIPFEDFEGTFQSWLSGHDYLRDDLSQAREGKDDGA